MKALLCSSSYQNKPILIARVSAEEQKESGNSLPTQISRLEQYSRNKGFTILRTCSFNESTYTNSRSEFDAIIDYALSQKERHTSLLNSNINFYDRIFIIGTL